MSIILWLVVGGLVGWGASKIMHTEDPQEILLNVVVGIFGALIGGGVVSPALGASTVDPVDFSLGGLFLSLVGALAMLATVRFAARRQVR